VGQSLDLTDWVEWCLTGLVERARTVVTEIEYRDFAKDVEMEVLRFRGPARSKRRRSSVCAVVRERQQR
jgi:hypothetical protein